MTRFEKFIDSINTPEKLIKRFNEKGDYCFDDILSGFCNGDCEDGDKYVIEHCNECHLKYLSEEI